MAAVKLKPRAFGLALLCLAAFIPFTQAVMATTQPTGSSRELFSKPLSNGILLRATYTTEDIGPSTFNLLGFGKGLQIPHGPVSLTHLQWYLEFPDRVEVPIWLSMSYLETGHSRGPTILDATVHDGSLVYALLSSDGQLIGLDRVQILAHQVQSANLASGGWTGYAATIGVDRKTVRVDLQYGTDQRWRATVTFGEQGRQRVTTYVQESRDTWKFAVERSDEASPMTQGHNR